MGACTWKTRSDFTRVVITVVEWHSYANSKYSLKVLIKWKIMSLSLNIKCDWYVSPCCRYWTTMDSKMCWLVTTSNCQIITLVISSWINNGMQLTASIFNRIFLLGCQHLFFSKIWKFNNVACFILNEEENSIFLLPIMIIFSNNVLKI